MPPFGERCIPVRSATVTDSVSVEPETSRPATTSSIVACVSLPLGQGEVGARSLEVATSPAEMGLDTGALVEVNGHQTIPPF